MSHLPDLTSLSDLLHTSPSASSSRGDNEIPQGPLLNLAESTIQDIEPGNTTLELIKQQALKIEAKEKQEAEIRQRTESNQELEHLRTRLSLLRQQKAKRITQKQLNDLLQTNSNEYRTALQSRNKQQEDLVVKNLNVAPSLDWNKRLDKLRLFSPYLEIENIHTLNYYNSNNKMMRMNKFTIVSPLLFRLPLRIDIDSNDCINKIEIGTLNTPPMLTIALLSPSFPQVIIKNYIPDKKITLLMFAINSLSKLVNHRISIMYKIIRKYKEIIHATPTLAELLTEHEFDDNLRLFAIMKSLDTIQFDIDQYKVILIWNIVLQDTVTGTCQSKIDIWITDEHDRHLTRFKNMNQVFQILVQDYGLEKALESVFKNVFEYTR